VLLLLDVHIHIVAQSGGGLEAEIVEAQDGVSPDEGVEGAWCVGLCVCVCVCVCLCLFEASDGGCIVR
jgi:hypothetical protein